jgi:uncharacterized circularly permuted ATP-grasp superfamily protein
VASASGLRAFEAFLEDVYGPREILRANIVPLHCVLGSPHYQMRPMVSRVHGARFCT